MGDAVNDVVPTNYLASNSVLKQYRKRIFPDTVLAVESAPFHSSARKVNGERSDPQAVTIEAEKDIVEYRNKNVRDECEFSSINGSLCMGSSLNMNPCSRGDKSLKYLVAEENSPPDWDRVNLETDQQVLNNGSSNVVVSEGSEGNTRSFSINFLEAVRSLKSDANAWEPYIVSHHLNEGKKENCLFLLFTWCLCRPDGCVTLSQPSNSDMDSESVLQRDADFLSAMPYVPFDHGYAIHRRLLVSIHDALLNPSDLRNGSGRSGAMDWERLGFQGSDPATDLRSAGVFGLLQLAYLVQYYREFANDLWTTCTANGDAQGEYNVYRDLPFVLIGLNFSSFLLDALKDPMFAVEIRQRASGSQKVLSHADGKSLSREFPLFKTCCDYYVGCLFVFYESWLQLKKQREDRPLTIGDFGVVKAKVYARIKKNGIQFVLEACTKAHKVSYANLHFSSCRMDTVELDNNGTTMQFTSI